MTAIDRRLALARLASAGAAGAAAAACTTPAATTPSQPTTGTAAAPVAVAPGVVSPVAKEATVTAANTDPVQSLLPLGMPWPTPDPFLFCVHHLDRYPAGNGQFGPKASLAGRNIGQDFSYRDGWSMYHGEQIPGFPAHPHRGFETVTVVRKGLVDHSDSMGATARYGQGDVQWLTAGKGIQHSEMFPLLEEDADNTMELFQIWLNLPAKSKFAEPHFTMFWGNTVPEQTFADTAGKQTVVSVVAGKLGEVQPPAPPPASWASQANSDVAIWTLKLQPGATWTLPAAKKGSNRTLYFFDGDWLQLGPRKVSEHKAIVLHADRDVLLTAGARDVQCLVLQGRPIGEPVAKYGPFVMNTQEEIRQAFSDYQRTRFGQWPHGNDAPVHGREGRFAKRPDGTVERGT